MLDRFVRGIAGRDLNGEIVVRQFRGDLGPWPRADYDYLFPDPIVEENDADLLPILDANGRHVGTAQCWNNSIHIHTNFGSTEIPCTRHAKFVQIRTNQILFDFIVVEDVSTVDMMDIIGILGGVLSDSFTPYAGPLPHESTWPEYVRQRQLQAQDDVLEVEALRVGERYTAQPLQLNQPTERIHTPIIQDTEIIRQHHRDRNQRIFDRDQNHEPMPEASLPTPLIIREFQRQQRRAHGTHWVSYDRVRDEDSNPDSLISGINSVD